MSNGNMVFRKRQVPFTMISNSLAKDKNLSAKAKGIYLEIQCFISINDFTLNKDHLISLSTDGVKSFNSGWNELKKCGYLKQYRIPCGGIGGKFRYEYELLEVANVDTPSLINCDVNGDEKVADHIPQKGPYAKRTICLKDHMLNGGYNNNTDNNKTDNNKTNQLISSSRTEEEEKVNNLLLFCQNYDLKVSRKYLSALLDLYDYVKIKKALTKMTIVKDIKNYESYLDKVLEESCKVKEPVKVIEKSNEPKKTRFNNFKGREYTEEDYRHFEEDLKPRVDNIPTNELNVLREDERGNKNVPKGFMTCKDGSVKLIIVNADNIRNARLQCLNVNDNGILLD